MLAGCRRLRAAHRLLISIGLPRTPRVVAGDKRGKSSPRGAADPHRRMHRAAWAEWHRLQGCETTRFGGSSPASYGAGHQGNGVHNRIRWGVIKYVATYRRKMRPRVMAKIDQLAAGHAYIILLAN